jgi:BlaI family transcriptional regulator, penicillinase repressor
MPPTHPPVSDAELEVLKVLWEHAPLTVRQVETFLRRRKCRWAYNTILTLLSRLRAKGYVAQERAATGTAFLFRAAVSRQDLVGQGLTALADRICEGTASPLVQALVQSRRLSTQDVADLRKMLDEMQERK